jgi:uncharacterized coiled-coil protein SlyX
MGNSSSNLDKLNKAANQNVSSDMAYKAIKHFNEVHEDEIDKQNKDKLDLEFRINSTESSISITKENIADLTRKLTVQQERLQKLEATLADVKDKLVIFNSSKGGTRKKTLNKNNRKTRTSLCKKK